MVRVRPRSQRGAAFSPSSSRTTPELPAKRSRISRDLRAAVTSSAGPAGATPQLLDQARQGMGLAAPSAEADGAQYSRHPAFVRPGPDVSVTEDQGADPGPQVCPSVAGSPHPDRRRDERAPSLAGAHAFHFQQTGRKLYYNRGRISRCHPSTIGGAVPRREPSTRERRSHAQVHHRMRDPRPTSSRACGW